MVGKLYRWAAIVFPFVAVLLTSVPAAANETAGVVFLAQKTDESPNELWGAETSGENPFFIAEAQSVSGYWSQPALSPDGTSVAVAFANKIGVVDVKTGELDIVYDGSSVNNPRSGRPQWSPDGNKLIFVADVSTASQASLRGNVYTVAKDGTDLKSISISLPWGLTRVRDPSFSPTGRRIVFVTFNNQAKEGRIYTAKAAGTDLQLVYLDPAGWTGTTQLRDTSYSPDGASILFGRKGDPFELAVHRVQLSGGSSVQLTDEEADPGANDGASWLPNGSKITYSNYDYRTEELEAPLKVKVMDATGENPQPLLSGFHATMDPSFRQAELDEVIEAEELLSEYAPIIRYDSQESYRADSAAMLTDNWGDDDLGPWEKGEAPYSNFLWDADGVEFPGSGDLLGSSYPGLEVGLPTLNLETLGPTYPGGLTANENDWLDARNDHYVEDAQALEAFGYADRVYGHTVTDLSGQMWLQYWFFYYYNDFSFLGIGDHEGDWEMIQIGLNQNKEPGEVVFAQHSVAARCDWEDVQRSFDGRPVVYSSVGSHASYPKAGSYDSETPLLDDRADGEGLLIEPTLEPISDGSPAWVDWPGHWGNSRGGGVNQESPTGPAQHGQWSDPGAFANEADECFSRFIGEAPLGRINSRSGDSGIPGPPEILSSRIRGGQVVLRYRVDLSNEEPPILLFSIDTEDDAVSPYSETVRPATRVGRVMLPLPDTTPAGSLVALASAQSATGRSAVTRHVVSAK